MNEADILDNVCMESSNGCWMWLKATSKLGYGRLAGTYAHRISYEVFNGPIPAKLCVCHTCDNPPCVNPSHLFLGTCKDNTQDCIRKGRFTSLKGERSSSAKLKENDVLNILQKLKTGSTQTELARQYGVDTSTISHIKTGIRWKYLVGVQK